MNSILKEKRILIFQQRGWGKGIGRFLARKLYAEECKLAALTFKNTTHELIVNQPNAKYELIINNDEVMSRPLDYLDGDDFSLKEICQELGIDSIWPLASTLRNHIRCYEEKYYYAYRQNVSDKEIEDFVKAVFKYIKVFFNEFKPDVIISPNFVSLPHIMFNLYARQKGVPMFGITDCKIHNVYIFTYAFLDDKGPFWSRVDELNYGNVQSSNSQKAKQYIEEFIKDFKKPSYSNYDIEKKSLITRVKKGLRPFMDILRWYKNKQVNVLDSTGITIDYRPPRIILRDHYANKRYRKYANNFNYYPLEKVGKFVYFPLQFQPEATIDVLATHFNNQVETARQVAMSLPDDYTLVVKEHPGMIGLRTPSYLEKIARTVNIKLVDYRIPNETLILKTDLIVSPGSTTVAEAAFFKKPAIQLGNLGTTLKLPNVFKHSDITTLSKKIKEVLNVDLYTSSYDRQLENFVAAAYDMGFDFDYVKAWEFGTEDLEGLWNFYRRELESIFNSQNLNTNYKNI